MKKAKITVFGYTGIIMDKTITFYRHNYDDSFHMFFDEENNATLFIPVTSSIVEFIK